MKEKKKKEKDEDEDTDDREKTMTENGRVNIPQFYEDIRPVSEEEEELYKQIDPQEFDPKRYQRDLGVKKLVGGSEATDLLMRRWRQPTFSIHNIIPSHGGSCNTVIPSSVSARVSMRLVPDQLPEQIFASFKSFVDQKVCPSLSLFLVVPDQQMKNHNSMKRCRRETRSW